MAVSGELVSQARFPSPIRDSIFESFPHLNVCFSSLLTEVVSQWCVALKQLNYYSDVFITVSSPIQYLHFWVQASSVAGKFQGSDGYAVLDMRLENGGMYIHTHFLHRSVTVAYYLPYNATLGYQKRLYTKFYVHNRFSIQRKVTQICQRHGLVPLDCCSVMAQVSNYLYKLKLMEDIGLPRVQYIPTVRRPFVFVHVEKCAGSSLREYVCML